MKARNIFSVIITSLYVFAIVSMLMLSMAHAGEDTILQAPIKSVIERTDKNGQTYVRIIISMPAQLNGIKYNRSYPLMAFSDVMDQIEGIKAGDTIRCIASKNEYKGRISYTLLAVIE